MNCKLAAPLSRTLNSLLSEESCWTAVGVVVSSFYEIRAALDSNKSEALSIRSQLQELQQYMKERFIEFVPTLGSGSGGGPEFFRPVTA